MFFSKSRNKNEQHQARDYYPVLLKEKWKWVAQATGVCGGLCACN